MKTFPSFIFLKYLSKKTDAINTTAPTMLPRKILSTPQSLFRGWPIIFAKYKGTIVSI